MVVQEKAPVQGCLELALRDVGHELGSGRNSNGVEDGTEAIHEPVGAVTPEFDTVASNSLCGDERDGIAASGFKVAIGSRIQVRAVHLPLDDVRGAAGDDGVRTSGRSGADDELKAQPGSRKRESGHEPGGELQEDRLARISGSQRCCGDVVLNDTANRTNRRQGEFRGSGSDELDGVAPWDELSGKHGSWSGLFRGECISEKPLSIPEIRECGFAEGIRLTIVAARRKQSCVTGKLTAKISQHRIPYPVKNLAECFPSAGFFFALVPY